MRLKKDDVIVFYGDSVTDTCRFVNPVDYGFGSGYALMVDAHINTNFKDLNVKMYNKGISGNRTKDLVERVNNDVIALNPNYVFILIGVNDAWRRFDSNDPTSVEQFIKNYKTFLDAIKKEVPKAQIVLLTPFTLPSTDWVLELKDDLNEKIEAVINLAKEYNLPLIRLHEILPEYGKKITPNMVSVDGVHPTLVGHAIIADLIVKYLLSD